VIFRVRRIAQGRADGTIRYLLRALQDLGEALDDAVAFRVEGTPDSSLSAFVAALDDRLRRYADPRMHGALVHGVLSWEHSDAGDDDLFGLAADLVARFFTAASTYDRDPVGTLAGLRARPPTDIRPTLFALHRDTAHPHIHFLADRFAPQGGLLLQRVGWGQIARDLAGRAPRELRRSAAMGDAETWGGYVPYADYIRACIEEGGLGPLLAAARSAEDGSPERARAAAAVDALCTTYGLGRMLAPHGGARIGVDADRWVRGSLVGLPPRLWSPGTPTLPPGSNRYVAEERSAENTSPSALLHPAFDAQAVGATRLGERLRRGKRPPLDRATASGLLVDDGRSVAALLDLIPWLAHEARFARGSVVRSGRTTFVRAAGERTYQRIAPDDLARWQRLGLTATPFAAPIPTLLDALGDAMRGFAGPSHKDLSYEDLARLVGAPNPTRDLYFRIRAGVLRHRDLAERFFGVAPASLATNPRVLAQPALLLHDGLPFALTRPGRFPSAWKPFQRRLASRRVRLLSLAALSPSLRLRTLPQESTVSELYDELRAFSPNGQEPSNRANAPKQQQTVQENTVVAGSPTVQENSISGRSPKTTQEPNRIVGAKRGTKRTAKRGTAREAKAQEQAERVAAGERPAQDDTRATLDVYFRRYAHYLETHGVQPDRIAPHLSLLRQAHLAQSRLLEQSTINNPDLLFALTQDWARTSVAYALSRDLLDATHAYRFDPFERFLAHAIPPEQRDATFYAALGLPHNHTLIGLPHATAAHGLLLSTHRNEATDRAPLPTNAVAAYTWDIPDARTLHDEKRPGLLSRGLADDHQNRSEHHRILEMQNGDLEFPATSSLSAMTDLQRTALMERGILLAAARYDSCIELHGDAKFIHLATLFATKHGIEIVAPPSAVQEQQKLFEQEQHRLSEVLHKVLSPRPQTLDVVRDYEPYGVFTMQPGDRGVLTYDGASLQPENRAFAFGHLPDNPYLRVADVMQAHTLAAINVGDQATLERKLSAQGFDQVLVHHDPERDIAEAGERARQQEQAQSRENDELVNEI